MKRAPDSLKETGKRYWKTYLEDLLKVKPEPTNTDYLRLEDLCYWEERKEEAKKELEKAGTDVIVYKDSTGKVKHTQPIAMMSNLRSAQEKIEGLRERLFNEPEAKEGAGRIVPMKAMTNEDKLQNLK